MDRDLFRAAANRIRAEQFLEGKTASARGVDAVTVANLAHTAHRMETEWAKVAAGAVGSGVILMRKTAEPPPPKGMSSKEWDKILSKGPPKG